MASAKPFIAKASVLELRRTASLAELLLEHHPELNLRRNGDGYRGVCPWEQKADRLVVDDSGFYCHGCHRSGSLFDWFMEQDSVEYPEAVERVAALAGVTLQYEAMSRAAEKQLGTDRTAKAVLGRLAALTHATARALPVADQVLPVETGAQPVARLIETGELGRWPRDGAVLAQALTDAVTAVLQEEGPAGAAAPAAAAIQALVSDVSAILGINDLARLADQWMLWSLEEKGPTAGRTLMLAGSRSPLVIGLKGNESGGWVAPPKVKHQTTRGSKGTAIATTDALYCQLREAGFGTLVRPISRSSMKGKQAGWMARTEITPVILVTEAQGSREAGYALAVGLAPAIPRIRVCELPDPAGATRDPWAWVSEFQRRLRRAGTAFDWQVQSILRHGALTPARCRKAAERLAPLATAAGGALERAAFAAELHAVTGLTLEEVTRPAPTPAVPAPAAAQGPGHAATPRRPARPPVARPVSPLPVRG